MYGEKLNAQIRQVIDFEKRDCYESLKKFLSLKLAGRVCLLYGLRRTGKTTLLFQAMADMPEEDRAHAVYIKARTFDTMADLDADLDVLWKHGYRYVFIDEYIRYGGTLLPGELAFDDKDALTGDVAFRDDETTRRYIDTAICGNIQHSLRCCKRGSYFRHLRTLYDAGELTSAINRIIESMNHQYLLSALTNPFKPHDLGSAAELLRKQTDPKRKTRILDQIDREAVTQKLMELLQILSRNEFDMVIYTSGENTCEVYEIKHSAEIVPCEYCALEDEEQCSFVEKQYGRITRKRVSYRGPSCMLENGIEYLNAEEYLKSLRQE